VPRLFSEFEGFVHANITPANLQELVLHVLWEKYRYDSSYKWTDRRIRAEAGGVSLSARAGAVTEINVGGIRHLARTIRASVETELSQKHRQLLPEPDSFDEAILRTLIREFGTLSYEFGIEESSGRPLFGAHAYFGSKPRTSSPDSLPHLNVHISKISEIEQLQFVLDHLAREPNGPRSQVAQIPLF
jgi:hypothetical protein